MVKDFDNYVNRRNYYFGEILDCDFLNTFRSHPGFHFIQSQRYDAFDFRNN